MGCTACKEESNMNQAPNEYQRRITNLGGIKRIGSPPGSFAKVTPSPRKDDVKSQTPSEAPQIFQPQIQDDVREADTESPKMVLVETMSEPFLLKEKETPTADEDSGLTKPTEDSSTIKAADYCGEDELPLVQEVADPRENGSSMNESSTNDNNNNDTPNKQVQSETEPSPLTKVPSAGYSGLSSLRGQNSPSNRNEARLSNWIKERQDKILAEKNQTNAPEGGGELTLVAVTRPDYSHKEKKQDDASVQSSVKNDSEMDQESQKASHISRISFEEVKVVPAAGRRTEVSTGSEIMQETPLFQDGQPTYYDSANKQRSEISENSIARKEQDEWDVIVKSGADNVDEDDDSDCMDDVGEETNGDGSSFMLNKPSPGRLSLGSSSGVALDWRKMPLTVKVDVSSLHEHQLELCKQDPNHRRSVTSMSQAELEELMWNCNGVELFEGGCKSGITQFDLHPGIKVWRCNQVLEETNEDCDFDFCEMCVRWTIHCERSGTDLRRLL